jgi:hypothetical protein
MCGIRLQVRLTSVARRLVAVPITRIAQPDGAATGRAVGNGIGNGARGSGAASAVVRIVIDINLAAVVHDVVAVLVASQAARDSAEAVAGAVGVGIGQRARNARIGRASGAGIALGCALFVTELVVPRTLPILQVIQVDGERTSGKCVESNQEQHTDA